MVWRGSARFVGDKAYRNYPLPPVKSFIISKTLSVLATANNNHQWPERGKVEIELLKSEEGRVVKDNKGEWVRTVGQKASCPSVSNYKTVPRGPAKELTKHTSEPCTYWTVHLWGLSAADCHARLYFPEWEAIWRASGLKRPQTEGNKRSTQPFSLSMSVSLCIFFSFYILHLTPAYSPSSHLFSSL